MLYGDLQEIWFDPEAPINPTEIPKFPIVPVSFESNYKADIGNIYGLPASIKYKIKSILHSMHYL